MNMTLKERQDYVAKLTEDAARAKREFKASEQRYRDNERAIILATQKACKEIFAPMNVMLNDLISDIRKMNGGIR